MAKPIRETPVLKGDDAKLFMDNMIISASSRIDLPIRERIKANYNKLDAISKL